MKNIIDRLKRIHISLGNLKNFDLNTISPKVFESNEGFFFNISFSQNDNPNELDFKVHACISNVASIKDHLKKWVKESSRDFDVENFINCNTDVAIIHDLWNLDKHAGLDRAPRSGFTPVLRGLKTVMRLSTGTQEGASITVSFDPKTGKMIQEFTGGSSASLDIIGEIFDQNSGQRIGDFNEIISSVVSKWEIAAKSCGVLICD